MDSDGAVAVSVLPSHGKDERRNCKGEIEAMLPLVKGGMQRNKGTFQDATMKLCKAE